ncbi:hypothetical protein CPB84DRAFT_1776109, partial [Gymnopilus junonius]
MMLSILEVFLAFSQTVLLSTAYGSRMSQCRDMTSPRPLITVIVCQLQVKFRPFVLSKFEFCSGRYQTFGDKL